MEEVLSNWEPRAVINDISARPDLDRNAYELVVNFYVVGSTEPVTISTFLERLR